MMNDKDNARQSQPMSAAAYDCKRMAATGRVAQAAQGLRDALRELGHTPDTPRPGTIEHKIAQARELAREAANELRQGAA